jgi:hypothetical protein
LLDCFQYADPTIAAERLPHRIGARGGLLVLDLHEGLDDVLARNGLELAVTSQPLDHNDFRCTSF